MPEIPIVLAIDVGSSSTRTIPFDRNGTAWTSAISARAHTVRTAADGAAELDADELVRNTVECVGETLRKLGGDAASLRGVGISCFMHSFLGVDESGETTTPVLMWSDTRSANEVRELTATFPGTRLHEISGCPPHTSYASAKLLYLKRHQPEVFRRTVRWISMGDFLVYRIFGRAVACRSLASSLGLVDVTTGDWSSDVLDFLGICRETLPEIVSYDTAFTGVRDKWRDALGSVADLEWFPANGDGLCGNVGSGACDLNSYALNIGTSGAIRLLDRSLTRRAPEGLWCYLSNDNRPYVGGAVSNAGNYFQWLTSTMGLMPSNDLDAMIDKLDPDAHGLTMLPFLLGERSVGWKGEATAAIAGVRANTTPVEILRAGLETVAIRLALILERLRPLSPSTRRMVVSGGVLRSPAWVRIVADTLGMTLYESVELEASSRGAAILTLYAMGEISDLNAVPAQLGAVHDPNPKATERYRAAMERHLSLYRKLVANE